MATTRINPGQSKSARELLKCNINDIVKMARKLNAHAIHEFEEGNETLQQADMKMLIETYEKNGIVFYENGKVGMVEPEDKDEKPKATDHNDVSINTKPTSFQSSPIYVAAPKPNPAQPAYKVVGGVMIPQSAKSTKPIVPSGTKPKKPI